MKIFISAGHNTKQSGAVVDGVREADLTRAVKNRIQDISDRDEFVFVPDTLTLRQSIDFVNERCSPDDIAVEIHFNTHRNARVRGTETYYYRDFNIASKMAHSVSQHLTTPDRGAIPDTQSYLGYLGWVRKLDCRSVLLEVCYLSNPTDMSIALNNKQDIALAIYDFCVEYLPIQDEPVPTEPTPKQQKITLIKRMLALYQQLLDALTGKPEALGGRSAGWRDVRNEFARKHPKCAICNSTKISVHHKYPVHLDVDKKLELDYNNLISLCDWRGRNCHWRYGHLFRWKNFNPEIEKDAKIWNKKIKQRNDLIAKKMRSM